jgi:drug/metabolite transporter (DMT)-like permease
VAAFTLCWAVVETIGPAAGVSAYQVVWTRYGVHLAFMLLVFGPRYGKDLVRTSHPGRQVVASLLMLGMPLCFIWGAQRMPVQDETAALWLAPVIVVGISGAIGWSYGGLRTIVATAIGFAGAMLICAPDAGLFRRAACLGIGAALCLSLYMVVMRTMAHERIITKLLHTALWVWLVLTLGVPSFWTTPTVHGAIAMAAIGLLGWLGLLALDVAIAATPVGALAPILYTQLVWAVVLARLTGQVTLTAKEEGGIALVLIAGGLALFRRSAQAAPDREVEASVGVA